MKLKLQKNILNFCLSIKNSDFLKKIVQTFLTRVLVILIGVVSSVIVARILGPEGRGVFAIATAVGAIGIQFANLGIQASNTYYVSKNRGMLSVLLSNSLVLSIVFGSISIVFPIIIFSIWPTIAPLQGLILFLALLWIPFGLAYLYLQNLLIGIQEIGLYNKIELVTRVLYTLLILLFVFIGLTSVEWFFSVSIIIGIISIVWIYVKLRKIIIELSKPSIKVFNDSFKYGIKAYIVALFSFLVLKVDIFMVNHYLNTEQTGYYSIAVTLIDMIYMLPVVVGTILFPKLTAMENYNQKRNFAKKALIIFIPIIIVIILICGFLANFIVVTLFGETFAPSIPAFLWLLPALLFLSINTIYMNFFASVGMPKITMYITGIATIINIIFNAILIPEYGLIGAAISSIVSYAFMLVVSVFYTMFNRGE